MVKRWTVLLGLPLHCAILESLDRHLHAENLPLVHGAAGAAADVLALVEPVRRAGQHVELQLHHACSATRRTHTRSPPAGRLPLSCGIRGGAGVTIVLRACARVHAPAHAWGTVPSAIVAVQLDCTWIREAVRTARRAGAGTIAGVSEVCIQQQWVPE